MEQEVISGAIVAVIFSNPQNGYAVLRLDSEEGGLVTVVGTIPSPAAGEKLIVTGHWVVHAGYGRQFEAEFLDRMLPQSAAEIRAYLASRAVRGIGPKTAGKIVERFGEASLQILDASPERLTEIEGISHKKALEIGEAFRRQLGVRRLIEFLTESHIAAEVAVRVYRIFGEHSEERIRDNPYLLAQPQFGAPFAAADELAIRLGLDADDDRRVEAGVLFELRHNLNNGHTFLPRGKLAAATAALLDVQTQDVEEAFARLEEPGQIDSDRIAQLEVVYLPEYYVAETQVAARVLRAAQREKKPSAEVKRHIARIEERSELRYADLQREAIALSAECRMMILTGGPGTGKTTTLTGILQLFDALERKTLLAAPTGRAAKRLSELTGRDALTIHRLLEAQISPENGEMFFARDEDNLLKCDALIVDEVSMVDLLLFHCLLRALPEEATLILVGDPDQLPPVGAGNVFSDLIRSGCVPTVRLTGIFRQARGSRIVTNAHAINRGELPELSATSGDFFFLRRRSPEAVVQTVTELVSRRLPQNMKIPAGEIQVISPTRRGECGTVQLNRALQEALNPHSADKNERIFGEICFREGDRVMQIRNNYDILWKKEDGSAGTGVYNGDIGQIVRIDSREDCLILRFDDREVRYTAEQLGELEPAYAVTAHKSQGSEYRAVVLVSSVAMPRLLTRSVLYTAVTRARELLVMVGNEQTVAQMVENNHRDKRYSGLRLRLLGGEA